MGPGRLHCILDITPRALNETLDGNHQPSDTFPHQHALGHSCIQPPADQLPRAMPSEGDAAAQAGVRLPDALERAPGSGEVNRLGFDGEAARCPGLIITATDYDL